jgi:hypothetical protein
MDVELPYGRTTLRATLPEGTRVLSSLETAPPAPVPDLGAAVRAALAQPRGLPRIRDLVKPSGRVTIAFDDHTVGSFGPLRAVAIRAVLEELEAAGVSRGSVTLVCANALHRMLRPAELARLLGPDLVAEFGARLVCHDAEDPAQVVDLGRTAEHGYPVEVSRLVAESDLTVYVNARIIRGFTGGWKSVCVGLSTWRTIRVTHTPDGMSMSVHRNRMHAVLDEMGHHLEQRLGRRIFKIDTILADASRVARVVAGSVDEARREVLAALEKMSPPRRELSRERFDVLVWGVPDASPYAVFASENPILTLISNGLGYLGGMIEAAGKPGCTVILATPTPDRWDRVAHASYPEVWERILPVTRDPYEIMTRYAEDYARRPDYVDAYRHRFAFHPIHGILATHPLKRLRHVGRVIVAAPEDPAVPRHLGFEAAASVEEAVAAALAAHGRGATLGCVEQSPMVSGGEST